jgi:LuxR family transcriptional regulator, maltose regulon positive regulatory protein
MAEGAVDKPPVTTRRRIIERPRLTRLLDESQARIKMLVAPAGYGKTTLARQWLSSRKDASRWIACTPAFADVALLLTSLAATCAETVEHPSSRTIERLQAATDPTRELDLLLDLLIDDLRSWPSTTWMVLDDYHDLMTSDHAEKIIRAILDRSEVPVLITSRRRPTWATARALFYGELEEITQSQLAMTDGEVNEALGRSRGGAAADLIIAAKGWPAFISLAAGLDDVHVREAIAQATMYDYLATEIYLASDEQIRHALRELAMAPREHGWLLRQLYEPNDVQRIEHEAVRLGMLTEGPSGVLELHPLLQDFLQRQCFEAGPKVIDSAFLRLWEVLVANERWDEAFALLERARRPRYLPVLLRASLEKLLLAGRSASLRKWIAFARENELDDPIVKLADAELAVRTGQFARAEVIALEAAQSSDPVPEEDIARGWCLAGQAAQLQSNEDDAIKYFRRARGSTSAEAIQRIARWGEFVALVDLESNDSEDALHSIVAETTADISSVVARWNAQLLFELRLGGIRSLREAKAARDVIDLVRDPVRRAAFRSVYCSALSLSGRYSEALADTYQFLDDVEMSRVDFAIPHCHTIRAVALLGVRRFADAYEATVVAEQAAARLLDSYAVANACAIRSRVLLSEGRYDEALSTLNIEVDARITQGMLGEVLATRAVALACLGDSEALSTAAQARRITRSLETRVLCAMADAIYASNRNEPNLVNLVQGAFDVAAECNCWDLFVCGYRAHPEVLLPLRTSTGTLPALRRVMDRAQDSELSKKLGLVERLRGATLLSPRENEIHGLLALGLSNRQIAQRLVISESTVKLHVHHIFEKLGVKSRSAAAARYRGVKPDEGS